jgi:hypothetical protein
MIRCAVAIWVVLLTVVLILPYVAESATTGDDLTRNTVRLALLYYGVALNLMLFLRPADWWALTGRGRLARCCWSLAWLAYVIHVGMAFHYYHDWSHAAAVEHTRQASGFGPGIYFSHLFTLLWTADVAWWRLRPVSYAARSPWIDRLLHGYMAFVTFNATVVFESGFIRWAGVFLFVELAAVLLYRQTVLPWGGGIGGEESPEKGHEPFER